MVNDERTILKNVPESNIEEVYDSINYNKLQ